MKIDKSKRFLRLFIDVTNKCNLNCIMCGVHLDDKPRYDMPLDLYKKIAVLTFPYVKELWLSCGFEPFIVKDFMYMLSYIKEFKIPDSFLVTNATLLNETNINQLIDVGLGRICISVEGAKKTTYERIRKGANFEATLSKIELLNRLKEKLSSEKPEICFMTTLMRSNIEELQQLIMLGSRLKISEIDLKPIHVYLPEMVNESLENCKDRVAQCITQAKKIVKELNIRLILSSDLQSLINTKKEFIEYKKNGIKQCSEVQPVMHISSNGKVRPCSIWNGLPMGDFNSQDFWQIWESDEFEELRLGISSANFKEDCLKCRYLI